MPLPLLIHGRLTKKGKLDREGRKEKGREGRGLAEEKGEREGERERGKGRERERKNKYESLVAFITFSPRKTVNN